MKKLRFNKNIFYQKFLRVIIKIISVVFIFIILLFFSALFFHFKCKNTQSEFKPVEDSYVGDIKNEVDPIEGYRRPEEVTYLTFPEWYLVFNPQEYAEHLKNRLPSDFAYFASIGQFWGSYCKVYGITEGAYPFNPSAHTVESVIGISATVEYLVKGIYENTIGKLFEILSNGEMTPEDIYAASVAYEYGQFIPTSPWFEFPYGEKFIGLWTKLDFTGPHILRKFERKVILSIEYGIKHIYASVIKFSTRATYGIADETIYALIESPSTSMFEDPRIIMKKNLGDNIYLVTLPHYQGFTDTVPSLTHQDVRFLEIAGNDEILLTVIAPTKWSYTESNGVVLFTMPLLTDKESKRVAFQVPVKSLVSILAYLEREGLKIEHLYDY